MMRGVWVGLMLMAGLCSMDEAAVSSGTPFYRDFAGPRWCTRAPIGGVEQGGLLLGRGAGSSLAAAAAAGGLRLRGGQPSEETDDDALGRELEETLKNIRAVKSEYMEEQEGARQAAGHPKFMGVSRRMLPMTEEPNGPVMPNNFYDQFDDASSEDSQDPHNMERWAPSYEDLGEAMQMLGDAREYLESVSPDGIDKLCTENNATIEDIRPLRNSLGTRIGNLTAMEEVRQRALGKIEEMKFTHDLLKHHMDTADTRTSATQELEEEMAAMTEKDVNPAVALLHEWEKNKKHEHETGDFVRQHEERQSKGADQGLAVPSKPIPAPRAPIGLPRAVPTNLPSTYEQP